MALLQATHGQQAAPEAPRPLGPSLLAASAETSWWLWPNLLSLDAPIVCALWAILFARAYSLRLSWPEVAALFGSVWIIYASDRLLDVWRCPNIWQLRRRHLFAASHSVFFLILIPIVGLFVGAVVLPRLARAEVDMGLGLSLLVAAYLLSVHWAGPSVRGQLPKELAVGTFFAMGTTLPLWAVWRFSDLILPLTLFACLCSLNCMAIDRWENPKIRRSASTNRTSLEGNASERLHWTCLGIFAAVAFSGLLRGIAPPALWGMASSALLLALIHENQRRFTAEQLRVLADLALVLPAAVMLVTAW